MPLILAQVALNTTTNLPEDRMVNTFWFQANPDADLDALAVVLGDFYNALSDKLTAQVLTLTGHTIKMYDEADIIPRAPILETTFAFTGLASTPGMPHEVALCSSFQADPVSGQNQQQRRGRVYISGWASSNAGSGGRPIDAVRIQLANATAQLYNDVNALGTGLEQVLWVVYSRTADSTAPVTNGWVDNSWDTQRRRGVAPSTRTTWS